MSSYNVLVPNFEFPVPTLTPEALLRPPFQAGSDTNGSPLGICRAYYKNSEQVGKVLSNDNCNFGFGGGEVSLLLGESEALLFPEQPSYVLPEGAVKPNEPAGCHAGRAPARCRRFGE